LNSTAIGSSIFEFFVKSNIIVVTENVYRHVII